MTKNKILTLLLVVATLPLASCSVNGKNAEAAYRLGSLVAEDTVNCAKKKFDGCVFPESEGSSSAAESIPEGLSSEELEEYAEKSRN